MKSALRSLLAAAVCAAGLAFLPCHARADEPGVIDFGPLLAGTASNKNVEINLPEPLLNFAATLAKGQDAEAAALLKDLKQVRVHVLGLDDKNRHDLTDRVHRIRADLVAKGWLRAVNVQDDGDDVAILVKIGQNAAIEGLTITVLDRNNEAVFVNIVGNIDPSRIAAIGEKYGIDPLKKIHCAAPTAVPTAAPVAPATKPAAS